MSPPIRVVLAEDHALVRAGLRRLISDFADIEVVAEAGDGREALALVAEHRPDVVILDITMPGLNGLNAVPVIKAEFPDVRILIMSMHDNEEYVWHALHSGAAGYVLKDAGPVELELAIRSAARGGSYLSSSVSRHVVGDWVRRVDPERTVQDRLSPRQLEIVQLIAEGHTNAQMARMLGLSVKTIETHRSQLMLRLDVHDVAGVVRYAVRMGLVTADR